MVKNCTLRTRPHRGSQEPDDRGSADFKPLGDLPFAEAFLPQEGLEHPSPGGLAGEWVPTQPSSEQPFAEPSGESLASV
jgi:hypothetical protein